MAAILHPKLQFPQLDYGLESLEKTLPKNLIEHLDNFHKTHIEEYNTAVEFLPACRRRSSVASDTEYQQSKIDMLAEEHANYCLFWKNLTPNSTEPKGDLLEQIIKQFGSLDDLIDTFNEKLESTSRGWIFLVKKRGSSELSIVDKNIALSTIPLLVVNSWDEYKEDQYNITREKYFAEIWDIINWTEVESRWNSEHSAFEESD